MTTTQDKTQRLLTVAEVAERLRVSPWTIYRRAAEGSLPSLRVGQAGPLRFTADAVETLLRPTRIHDRGDTMKIPTKLAPRKQTTTSAIADAIGMDVQTAIDAARLATAAAARIPTPPPNPVYRTLAEAEQGALRRFSPRRSWPDLAEHDQRIAEADRDRETVRQRIQDLRQQLTLATVQDEQRLIGWLRDELGARPEPGAPVLEQEITQAEAELVARAAIIAELEAQKERFVAKHRRRLFTDATEATEAARDRYLAAIDSLASLREEIRNARQAAIYAQLYPSALTGSEPPTSLIAGRLDVMRRLIPGLNTTLDLGGVQALLREDARYVATAATASQASEIAGRDVTQPTAEQGGATWVQTDEGREAETAERKAALERYRRDNWGADPA